MHTHVHKNHHFVLFSSLRLNLLGLLFSTRESFKTSAQFSVIITEYSQIASQCFIIKHESSNKFTDNLFKESSYSNSVSNPYWTVQFKLVSQHSRTPIIIKRSIHSFRSFPDDAFETHCEKIHAQWLIPVIATPLMSPAAVSFKETYCTYVIGKPY